MEVRRSSGMIYTVFTLIASSLILVIALLSISGPTEIESSDGSRIASASFFQESILGDMDRVLELGTERAMASVTDFVITNGEGVDDAKERLITALVNGTVEEPGMQNVSMENASLRNWREDVKELASRTGYSLRVDLDDYGFNSSDLVVNSSFSVFSRLEDPVSLASFNQSETTNISLEVSGLEDAMITLQSGGEYTSIYSKCPFDDPAEKFSQADTYSNTTYHGKAAVNPSNPGNVPGSSERILAVDDIDTYMSSEDEFRGVVSADPNSSSLSNSNYAVDTGSITNIEDNMSITVSNGSVWRTGFRQMFRNDQSGSCYVPDSEGPGFLDRLENEMISDDPDGVATLVNLARLDSADLGRSSVGYIYFNSSYTHTSEKIAGVTGEYQWFRLDQDHIDTWGVNGLVK